MTALPLAPDGAPPTRDELLTAFDALLDGRLSREEGAAWARARRDAPPERGQFGAMPHGPSLAFAFWALLAVDVTEGAWDPLGPPYFIRDVDLRAHAAMVRDGTVFSLDEREPPRRGIPLHAGALALSPAAASARLGVETLRGLDDLDYYEDLEIVDAGGRRAVLQWRPASQHPGEAYVILPPGGGGWRQDLGELLELLGLGDEAVRWRNDAEAWRGE